MTMINEPELMGLLEELDDIIKGNEIQAYLHRIFPPEESKMVLECGVSYRGLGLSYALEGCETLIIDPDSFRILDTRKVRSALNSFLVVPIPVSIRYGKINKLKMAKDVFDLVFSVNLMQRFTSRDTQQQVVDQMAKASKDHIVVIN